MQLTYQPATLDDILHVALNIREEDRQELRTVHPKRSVWVTLVKSRSVSRECYSIFGSGDSKPIGLIGVADSSLTRKGIVWLVGTPRVRNHALSLVTDAAKWRDRWRTMYPALCNIVDERNHIHIRWLQLLGFEPRGVVTVNNHPFRFMEYV